MGKLTSSIGIPIKLLNEAQVHTLYSILCPYTYLNMLILS